LVKVLDLVTLLYVDAHGATFEYVSNRIRISVSMCRRSKPSCQYIDIIDLVRCHMVIVGKHFQTGVGFIIVT
jgi:hypothetical protein